jgi:hypothetical protein
MLIYRKKYFLLFFLFNLGCAEEVPDGLIYLPEVKLSHLHRWNKAAPDDKTYQEANDKKKREDDRLAFETWRDGPGLQEAKRLLTK